MLHKDRTMTEKEVNIKRFDGNSIDFRVWKIRVQTAMMAKDCEDAIELVHNNLN